VSKNKTLKSEINSKKKKLVFNVDNKETTLYNLKELEVAVF
jgi:hypothetical protein